MSKQRLTLPRATAEILEWGRHRYDCPKCGGHNHEGGFAIDSATGEWEFRPIVTLCSFCSAGGDVSFAEVVASEASPAYISLLFRLIRKEIKARTDDAYERAQTLVLLAYGAHDTAVKKSLADQSHLTTEQTLHEIVQVFTELTRCRKQAFDAGMAKAFQATQARLKEKAKAIAADADLRRRTLDAQKDIEDRFSQRY
jgi:hypothetical protein